MRMYEMTLVDAYGALDGPFPAAFDNAARRRHHVPSPQPLQEFCAA